MGKAYKLTKAALLCDNGTTRVYLGDRWISNGRFAVRKDRTTAPATLANKDVVQAVYGDADFREMTPAMVDSVLNHPADVKLFRSTIFCFENTYSGLPGNYGTRRLFLADDGDYALVNPRFLLSDTVYTLYSAGIEKPLYDDAKEPALVVMPYQTEGDWDRVIADLVPLVARVQRQIADKAAKDAAEKAALA